MLVLADEILQDTVYPKGTKNWHVIGYFYDPAGSFATQAYFFFLIIDCLIGMVSFFCHVILYVNSTLEFVLCTFAAK